MLFRSRITDPPKQKVVGPEGVITGLGFDLTETVIVFEDAVHPLISAATT